MKNTAALVPQPVSKKTVKENVQPVRVSDMGMRMKVTTEVDKKQLAEASV